MAARGRGLGGWVVAAILIMIFLVSTNTWNPFPGIWNWVDSSRTLSDPGPAWQERVGDRPEAVTQAGDALVVELSTSVEGRRVSDGGQVWSRKADWSAVAGAGSDTVAVMGRLLVKGYDVVDPRSGAVLRHDSDAVAVWTYQDAVLDVRCHSSKDCMLTAWSPRDGDRLWQVDVPGVGFVLFADNPKLQETHPLTTSGAADDLDGPEAMPPILGFPIDQKVYLVDTAGGRALPVVEPGRRDEIVVIGGRVVKITATPGDGACYFNVEGRDAATGGQVWTAPGVNLRTTSGSGCQQRRTPAGAGSVVVANASDGREAVISAYDGRALFIGSAGEKVLAVDNRYALVRSADGKAVKGMRLGRASALWTLPVHEGAEAALSRYGALVLEKKPDRIIAMDPATGVEKLDVRSSATVIATGPKGLVISDVRELGYLPFRAPAPAGGGKDG